MSVPLLAFVLVVGLYFLVMRGSLRTAEGRMIFAGVVVLVGIGALMGGGLAEECYDFRWAC